MVLLSQSVLQARSDQGVDVRGHRLAPPPPPDAVHRLEKVPLPLLLVGLEVHSPAVLLNGLLDGLEDSVKELAFRQVHGLYVRRFRHRRVGEVQAMRS